MPESRGIEDLLSQPMRSRGFMQTSRRVQAEGSVPQKIDEDTRRLWTETPQQRTKRIQSGETRAYNDDRLEFLRITARDAAIRERYHSENKQSLMDEHQQRRREQIRSEKRPRFDGEEHDTVSRIHRNYRSRNSEQRERDRNHSERSGRHSESSKRHSSRHSRNRSEKHSSHHKDRHSSHRSERNSNSESRKTKSQIAEEELMNGYAAPMFDRSRMIGGARLMDQRTRGNVLAHASQLGNRFAGGSSGSFL